jgi:hypothetical protein
VVFVVGLTDNVDPLPKILPFNDQVQVPPAVDELAVNVPDPPWQIVIGGTVIVGPGLTTTAVVPFAVPQLGIVTATV